MKPECPGTRIGNWDFGGSCTQAGVGFELACAGRSGSGSNTLGEISVSDLRTVFRFIDGDLVVMGVIPDGFQMTGTDAQPTQFSANVSRSLLRSSSLATATTWSGSKPNFL